MEKPKIKSIKSRDYDNRRIDLFLIEKDKNLHKAIIAFLLKIGFSNNTIQEFDRVYINEELFIFGNEKDIKVLLIDGPSSGEVFFILDSSIDKQQLMKDLEGYFEIF